MMILLKFPLKKVQMTRIRDFSCQSPFLWWLTPGVKSKVHFLSVSVQDVNPRITLLRLSGKLGWEGEAGIKSLTEECRDSSEF